MGNKNKKDKIKDNIKRRQKRQRVVEVSMMTKEMCAEGSFSQTSAPEKTLEDVLGVFYGFDGDGLGSTTYFSTKAAREFGFIKVIRRMDNYCFIIPPLLENLIPEFLTGKYCIITQTPSVSGVEVARQMKRSPINVPEQMSFLEFLFEDDSAAPFQMQINSAQVMGLFEAKRKAEKKGSLILYKKGKETTDNTFNVIEVGRMDFWIRENDKLPYAAKL